jgi:hypothetical protein
MLDLLSAEVSLRSVVSSSLMDIFPWLVSDFISSSHFFSRSWSSRGDKFVIWIDSRKSLLKTDEFMLKFGSSVGSYRLRLVLTFPPLKCS